jgi:hypothetical protein
MTNQPNPRNHLQPWCLCNVFGLYSQINADVGNVEAYGTVCFRWASLYKTRCVLRYRIVSSAAKLNGLLVISGLRGDSGMAKSSSSSSFRGGSSAGISPDRTAPRDIIPADDDDV